MKTTNSSGYTASHWGIFKPIFNNDGRIESLVAFKEDPKPSPNLDKIAKLPYSEKRIRYPMVRESYFRDGPASRDKRGSDRWIRVSWNDALSLVAKEMRRIYDHYGPNAMFGRSYGWMSCGEVNSAVTLNRRLLRLCGGFVECTNSYSTAAIAPVLSCIFGESDPQSSDWDDILNNSRRVVFWGCDPLITNDVDWCTTLHNSYPKIDALKASGINTIVINPLRTQTGSYLESEWIAPYPGTDCALMLAMIYTLHQSGRLDLDFIERFTVGFKPFMAYVLGEKDGIAKSAEWAEKQCGVPARKIRELAHELRDNRTMIMMGWGPQRAQFGEQPPRMVTALACALGHIGLPGGGLGTNYHYCSGGSLSGIGPSVRGIGSNVKPVLPYKDDGAGTALIPVARFAECFLNPGESFYYMDKKLTYPEIRMVMWAGGNPFSHQPQTNRLAESWKKPETVVVTDCFWTPTALNADIVLPACTFFERNDITGIGSYTNDGIVYMKKAIEPMYESKSDYEIYSLLAAKMGCADSFTCGRSEEDWIRVIYQEAAHSKRRFGITLPDYETFKANGVLLFDKNKNEKPYIAFEDFRKDPLKYPLKTKSGKIEITNEKIQDCHYSDCPPHPVYLQPTEFVLAKEKKYPFAFVSAKSMHRLHSQLGGLSSESGTEPVMINEENAREKNIVSGDTVIVKNDRGAILAKAFVTADIRKNVICMRHGAWYEPKEINGGTIDVGGCSNTLTPDIPTSRFTCGNVASSALVDVEKFDAENLNAQKESH